MKYRLLMVIFGIILFFAQNLSPVLDGRVTPIYLENRYTFSNYEWARGNVYFENGFDLPFGGTVIIGINQEVGGTIQMMNGTLRLSKNLALSLDSTLRGSGFIDARGKVITFKNNWNIQANERFRILSDVIFEGVGSNSLNLAAVSTSGGISVKNPVSEVRFIRFNIIGPYFSNFTTESFAPNVFTLMDSNILLLGDLTLNSNLITLSGAVTLSKSKATLTIPNRLRIGFGTTLYIQSQVTLNVGMISSSEESAQIILENAQLHYTPTGTYSLFFNRAFTGGNHQGTLAVRGRSQIVTPSGVELFFTKLSVIDFASGSLLKINDGTKFTIG